MKKWEYLTVFIVHGSDGSVSVTGWGTYSGGLDGILDDIGSCGWGLVCFQMDRYTFKRELAEQLRSRWVIKQGSANFLYRELDSFLCRELEEWLRSSCCYGEWMPLKV